MTVLMASAIVFAGNCGYVKAKAFEQKEIEMPGYYVSVDEKGGIYNYQVEELKGKKGYFWNIKKYAYKNNKVKMIQNIKSSDESISFVQEINKKKTLVVSDGKKKGEVKFVVYNKNGKKLSEITDKFAKKETYNYNMFIFDVQIKTKEIHYTYIKGEKVHIRSIDRKTGELLKDIALKTKGEIEYVKVNNNKIYIVTKKDVLIYSFDGRKIENCKLPTVIKNNSCVFDVVGNELFYSNGKDGIYICNLKKSNKWTLLYDANDDAYFTERRLVGLSVVDKDTFYASYEDKYYVLPDGKIMTMDPGELSKLVKYY